MEWRKKGQNWSKLSEIRLMIKKSICGIRLILVQNEFQTLFSVLDKDFTLISRNGSPLFQTQFFQTQTAPNLFRIQGLPYPFFSWAVPFCILVWTDKPSAPSPHSRTSSPTVSPYSGRDSDPKEHGRRPLIYATGTTTHKQRNTKSLPQFSSSYGPHNVKNMHFYFTNLCPTIGFWLSL